MYRTRQFHVKKNSRLYDYCRTMCQNSAILYNRANFILRQFVTAFDSFDAKKPLYSNQIEVYHLVMDILGGTKYPTVNKRKDKEVY